MSVLEQALHEGARQGVSLVRRVRIASELLARAPLERALAQGEGKLLVDLTQNVEAHQRVLRRQLRLRALPGDRVMVEHQLATLEREVGLRHEIEIEVDRVEVRSVAAEALDVFEVRAEADDVVLVVAGDLLVHQHVLIDAAAANAEVVALDVVHLVGDAVRETIVGLDAEALGVRIPQKNDPRSGVLFGLELDLRAKAGPIRLDEERVSAQDLAQEGVRDVALTDVRIVFEEQAMGTKDL
jgi:hypothetical protein